MGPTQKLKIVSEVRDINKNSTKLLTLSSPSLRIVDIRPKNAYKVNYLYIADRVSMYARMFYTKRGLLL